MLRSLIVFVFLIVVLTGCSSFGTISNQSLGLAPAAGPYSIFESAREKDRDDITLVLAFSGGGTRAAALSYGVLKALRDIRIVKNNRSIRLLDEVDLISSVSGGSFTAAYFGLYPNQIFTDFETRFLRKDVSADLLDLLLTPRAWFSSKARSEIAVEYYEQSVFQGATFKALMKPDIPMIVINASDLGGGVRFSFLQDYFDLLCSDLSTFPVARAVTASSAVPVLFSPVVLKNHSGCDSKGNDYLQSINPRLYPEQVGQAVKGLQSFSEKETRQYIHLVDGGITDNLGLMAVYDMVEIAGGAKAFSQRSGGKTGRHFMVISVNASTHTQNNMEASNEVPSLEDTINTMTDIQLHRYNAATLDLMEEAIHRWSEELSTPEDKVSSFFVNLGFDSLDKERQAYFNTIPTSFTLTEAQADDLIALGKELLGNNFEFQRFLKEKFE